VRREHAIHADRGVVAPGDVLGDVHVAVTPEMTPIADRERHGGIPPPAAADLRSAIHPELATDPDRSRHHAAVRADLRPRPDLHSPERVNDGAIENDAIGVEPNGRPANPRPGAQIAPRPEMELFRLDVHLRANRAVFTEVNIFDRQTRGAVYTTRRRPATAAELVGVEPVAHPFPGECSRAHSARMICAFLRGHQSRMGRHTA
jgi:hypothetical protein